MAPPTNESDSGLLAKELRSIRGTVEGRLEKLVPGADQPPELLHRAIRYSLLAPGKRIRPAVTLLCASAFGGNRVQALDPACAVEMVHTASLILDDLPSMDDAKLRRGQATNHLVFGEDMAILAAVSLLNSAYGVIGEATGLQPAVKTQLVSLLSMAIGTGGLIAGQAVDLRSVELEVDFRALEYIHSRKTGALFTASAEIGALLSGLSGASLQPVRAYAKNLGLAFQILDDLIDAEARTEDVGKDVRQDVKKTTFLSFSGREGAKTIARELIEVAVESLKPFGKEAELLRALATDLIDGTREAGTNR